jgi:hypothetical protein
MALPPRDSARTLRRAHVVDDRESGKLSAVRDRAYKVRLRIENSLIIDD